MRGHKPSWKPSTPLADASVDRKRIGPKRAEPFPLQISRNLPALRLSPPLRMPAKPPPMTPPRRLTPHSSDLPDILALIRSSFAYMEGRIDPPSSMYRMTLATLQDNCRTSELWGLGTPPHACVILTPKPDCLYLGKLAVSAEARNQGCARQLIDHALDRARAHGLTVLELQTRIELVENHAAFAAMGFVRTGETAHAGYDRPTSITMRRTLTP